MYYNIVPIPMYLDLVGKLSYLDMNIGQIQ